MKPVKERPKTAFCLPANAAGMKHIEPDNKSKTSKDDQKHSNDVHGKIRLIGNQTVRPKNIDSRIAQSRDGGKNRLP